MSLSLLSSFLATDLPATVLVLSGERESGRTASVVLALALAGDPLFPLASAPVVESAPAPVVVAQRTTIEVYAAVQTCWHLRREKVVNAWVILDFGPIAAAEDLETSPGFRFVQESCYEPAYIVEAPATAERIGPVVRLAPETPPPWMTPDGLVLNASAGKLGLSLVHAVRPLREWTATVHTRPKDRPATKPDGRKVVDKPGQLAFGWAS
jgi:hypothetical protein